MNGLFTAGNVTLHPMFAINSLTAEIARRVQT